MQKKFLLWLVLFALTQTTHAQIIRVTDQVPDTLFSEDAYDQLDTSSWLTTTFLWDRIEPNLNLYNYAGNNDDPIASLHAIKQAYLELEAMSVEPWGKPDYIDYLEMYRSQMRGTDAIPIISYAVQYNTVKSNAIATGLMSYTNGQFTVNPNATSSPFTERTYWSSGLLIDEVPVGETLHFVMPKAFLISNLWSTSDKVVSVQVDADDGQGYRAINWDVPFSVYYSEGEAEKILRVMFTKANGGVEYSQMSFKTMKTCRVPVPDEVPWPKITRQIQVYVDSTWYDPLYEWNGQTYYDTIHEVKPYLVNKQFPYLLEATDPYLGEKAMGNVYIRYRNSAAPGDKTFKKPIIFVEGIDFKFGLHYESAGYTRFGTTGWNAMWGCDDKLPFELASDYLDSLTAEDYDVIMLDFEHGSDYMQRNGLLMMELINQINAHKVGNEENVIVGFSMGGQVARYALTYMEHHQIPHCTRAFISFDSPWNGAHIPLGMQSALMYMANVVRAAGANELIYSLRRPAAKQMLIYHYDRAMSDFSQTVTLSHATDVLFSFPNGQLAPSHLLEAFVNEVEEMGSYPKHLRNLAIVNGSNNASPLGRAGDQFINYNENCNLKHMRAELYKSGRADGWLSRMRLTSINHLHIARSLSIKKVDYVAGSSRDDISTLRLSLWKGLAGLGCPNAHVTSPVSAAIFVTSTSALAVNNGNWEYEIDDIPNFDPTQIGLTHFDGYYAQASNQEHVEVTNGNMNWLMKQLRNGENIIQQAIPSGVLTKTWNNPLENTKLPSIDINTGGTLYVNGDLPRFDGGHGTAPARGLARVFVGGECSSAEIINLNNGGKLILGDNNSTSTRKNNRAYLHITNGSELNIHAGGELKINDGSKLVIQNGGTLKVSGIGAIAQALNNGLIVIEDGGTLIYEQDAQINLVGQNSILEVGGKIQIGNNAEFTFTGNGHMVLDQHIGQFVDSVWTNLYDDYWSFGTNASINLQGSGSNDVILVLKNGTHPRMSDGTKPASISIRSGLIQIGKDEQFHISSDLTMNSVRVECLNPNQTHGGIRFWNQNATINNCEFVNGGSIGALALFNIGGNKTVKVQYSDFSDNEVGLFVSGEGVDITGSQFENNTTGAIMDYVSRSSKVTTSKFKTNDVGLKITGQAGFSINLSYSEFSNNTVKGLELISVESSVLTKNQFISNYIGVESYGSVVDISQQSYNCFENNQVGISLIGNEGYKAGLYLANGYNRFDLGTHSNGKYIVGRFCPSLPLSLYQGSQINANNNMMPTVQVAALPGQRCCASIMPVSLTHYSSCSGVNNPAGSPITLYIPNNLTSITGACGSSPGGTLDDDLYEERAVSLLDPGKLIFGEPFNKGLPIRDAILEGAAYISRSGEDVRNDELALNYMKAVLGQTGQNWTSQEQKMLDFAYSLAKKAYANLHQYNEEYTELTVPSSDAHLSFLTSYISSELAKLLQNGGGEMDKKFAWNLDQGQLYRVGNYYTEAITQLGSAITWATGLEYERANFWKCICEAEKNYVDGASNEEEFQNATRLCVSTNPNASFKNDLTSFDDLQGYPVGNGKIDNEVSRMFPNPTSGKVTVEMKFAVNEALIIQVADLRGHVMFEEDRAAVGMSFTLDLSKLSPGVYQVTLLKSSGKPYTLSQQIIIQ
ncbi:MAG: T9SS type A sorting domain-containing protein [Bacteroidetes bacterium]|nr:MAG: T9SS type A sorting domain-containing protein [Bacteroidota bacterium]